MVSKSDETTVGVPAETTAAETAQGGTMETEEKKGLLKGKLGSKKAKAFSGPKKKKKKIIIIAVILVIVLVVIGIKVFGGDKDLGLPVSTSKIERADVEQAVAIQGTIEGTEKAEVTSQLNNKVTAIYVKEGDRVTKGQTLAMLDANDISNEVTTAQDQYQSDQYSLQDTLKETQRSYDAAVRALNESKKKYDNNVVLYSEGAISKADLDASQNTYLNDQATVNGFDAVNGKITASASQQKKLDMQRENLAQKQEDLQNMYIKSPIDGTVTRVNASLGRYAKDTENNQAMFIVEDLDHLKMNVKISENDIGKIQVGQKVAITGSVLGGATAEGVVSNISPTGELKDQSSKEMIVPVKIDILPGTEGLIAGVTAKAKIEIEIRKDVISVPLDAVMQNPTDGKSQVFIVKSDSTLKAVPIELGLEGDFDAELKSGDLKEGDEVVLSPTYDMTDGMKVMLPQAAGAGQGDAVQ